ncbi:hypothetical protein B0H12DRAFT_1180519 [Mycena haematopus]|nr:hypothetical protein B0H12DRAFT_1180519 [Mycena haematopus]
MSIPTQESYLIVGGGTSVGEIIVDQLLRRGETRVSIFDAQPLAAEQAKRFGPAVHVYVGDVMLPQSMLSAIKSCEATCVIHVGVVSTPIGSAARYPTGLAPQPTAEDTLEELKALNQMVNTDGMRNVLAAALDGSVTQMVYIGNAGVTFDGRDRPMLREEDAPYPAKGCVKPQADAERMVLSHNGLSGLRTTVLRPAMVFGPGLATATIFRRIQASPSIAGFQMGDNLADHTYVDNVAHAAILAADRLNPTHPQHTATAGRAFFITNGEPRPFWEFMRGLWVAAGGTPPPLQVAQKGTLQFIAGVKDVMGTLFGGKTDARTKMQVVSANLTYDISLAREVLGYAPIVSLDEGMRRTAEWWLEQQLKKCQEKGATGGAASSAPPPYTPYIPRRRPQGPAVPLAEKSPFS